MSRIVDAIQRTVAGTQQKPAGGSGAAPGGGKPKGAVPAYADKAGIRHPEGFYVQRRKPILTGVLPIGTSDIAAPDERPREGHSKFSPARGTTKGCDAAGLKELSTEAFVQTYGKYAALEVKEALQAATRAKLLAVSEGVAEALQLLQATLAEAEADGGGDADPTPEASAALNLAFEALRLAAGLAYDVLAATREAAPAPLAEAAQLLHTHALLALEMCPAVQDAVARLCCAWWAAGGPDKEELLSQTLPFLLIRALTDTKGRACSVKPCLEMRHALGLLDFEDESIDDMKRLLLQAAKSSLFLRRPEGRRFLGHVLTLHPSLVAEVASVMRNMVVTGKQWVLEAVGEIILRGWREAVGPCAAAIETILIQGFAKALLYASSKGLASNVLVALHQLHDARRPGPGGGGGGGGGGLDSALARLYEPILFRALSAANPAVRRNALLLLMDVFPLVGGGNALLLLMDVFPLVDPEATEQEQDEGLTRQLAAAADALADPAPAVRAAAAPGVCALLDTYWEIIPSATTAAFVAKLADQLAFDAAAPGVRVAVLEGLRLLVDNVHAQPVLKRALPGLAPLMHDASPAVRVAMADLLLCISTSRGLKFWEVVPLDALLDVLARPAAADDGLAARVHHLLVPSYMPNAQEGAARVAALLRTSPAAGQAFCRLLAAPLLPGGGAAAGAGAAAGQRVPVPLERLISLAQALATHLAEHPPSADPTSPPRKSRGRRGGADAAAAKRGGGKRKKAPGGGGEGEGGSGSERDEEDVPAHGARDEEPDAWCSLLAGLCELAGGAGAALQQELCSEADVQGMFKPAALQQLLDSCPSPAARRHVWRIAERLPCLAAAGRLRANTLRQLAGGELLPLYGLGGADGCAVDGAEAAGGAAAREELGGILACLAAAPSCAKLSALLSRALGLPWGPAGGGGGAEGAGGAQGEGEEEGDEEEEDDIRCKSCGKAQPDHNLLLCDGCDAAYHTTCLRPWLAAVPCGEWFCPGCDGDIRGSALGAAAALECVGLLLGSDAGRQLLQASGLLSAALPALQRRCAAATEEALSAVAAAAAAAPPAAPPARGKKAAAAAGAGGAERERAEAALAACCGAAAAARLCARAAVHLSGVAALHVLVAAAGAAEDAANAVAAAGAARDAAAAALAAAVVDGSSALATAADWLQEARGAAGPAAGAPLAGAAARLAAGAAALLAVLGDALRLGVAPPGREAREQAAACGRSALGLLLALQPCAMEGPAEDVLLADTALLRLLLAPPAGAADAPAADGAEASAPAGGEQLGAWVSEWLQALSSGPLAGAAASVRPHVPALLGGLLAPGAAAAGAAPAAPEPWLRPLAEAVAAAAIEAAGGGSDSDDSDAEGCEEEQGENVDPNIMRAAGGGDAKKRRAAGGGGPLEVPPMVERDVAARCVAAALAAGRAGDWRGSLGALRLGRVLGAGRGAGGAGGAERTVFSEVRAAAEAAQGGGGGGGAAALLVAQIDRLAVTAGGGARGRR
ncbi:MAG: condensin II non structural maintenance of chromosomes subunit-domain-containing protein [Monoraphidium minutum]|nr:MAG: condensin II non structural maintenance of chromosomes subunit-domain-containing protein [Monoraphidium minutum]